MIGRFRKSEQLFRGECDKDIESRNKRELGE